VAALLTADTHAAAAEQAGISERTLQRWLLLDSFQAAYRRARATVLERVVVRLLGISGKAVARLERSLDSANDQSANRAALGVLAQAVKGAEALDVLSELAALKVAVEELQRGQRFRPPADSTTNGHREGVDPAGR